MSAYSTEESFSGFGTEGCRDCLLCVLKVNTYQAQNAAKPKQLHLMTCAAVFEWFERHEGLEYSKQSRNYNLGVPLGYTVVLPHIPLYL